MIGLDLAERLVEAGHSVLGPFTRCAEVREWIAHNTPDAAILDFKLLNGSCDETVRLLRDRGVPIVAFASGGDIPEDLADMVVVTKPGRMDQVLRSRVSRPAKCGFAQFPKPLQAHDVGGRAAWQ